MSTPSTNPGHHPESFSWQNPSLPEVLDALGFPFVVIDVRNFRVIVANRAASSSLVPGITCHEMLHHCPHPCRQSGCECPIEQVTGTGRPAVVMHDHYDSQGQLRHVEVHAYPMFDDQGRVYRVVEYTRDVTTQILAERLLREERERLRVLSETLEQRVAERTAELGRRADELRRLAAALAQSERTEQRRLAEILHDDVQQELLAIRMSVAKARWQLGDSAPAELLREVDISIGRVIEGCRTLAVELAPPVLSAAGLAAALKWLGRQMEERFGLVCTVVADETADPRDEDIATLVFQSVRELLLNVVKHAQVKSATIVMCRSNHHHLEIVVADQGAGFDVRTKFKPETVPGRLGLFSVAERLKFLGGSLSVDSAPGQGTRVTLTLPVIAGDLRD